MDEEDYAWLTNGMTFHPDKRRQTIYAKVVRTVNGVRRKMSMHRMIMERYHGPLGKSEVDHINGDALDNRKDNLRLAGRGEQMRNTARWLKKASSQFKGVFKDHKTFRVIIRKEGIEYHCGHYADERQAAIVYNLRAKELFGEFARLNDVNATPEEEALAFARMNDAKRREGCSSRYRGVSRSHRIAWRAAIGSGASRIVLGTFHTEEDAAQAYNEAAILRWGTKARLNVILPSSS